MTSPNLRFLLLSSVMQKEVSLIDMMLKAEIIKSRGEGRRLIEQGGVAVDDEKAFEYNCKFDGNEKSGVYTLRVQVYGEPEVREKTFVFENASRKLTGETNIQSDNAIAPINLIFFMIIFTPIF